MSAKVTCGLLLETECEGAMVRRGANEPSPGRWVTTTDWEGCAFCPDCGALLSFDAEGQPTARAQVPVNPALEGLPAWSRLALEAEVRKQWGAREWLTNLQCRIDGRYPTIARALEETAAGAKPNTLWDALQQLEERVRNHEKMLAAEEAAKC